MFQIVFCFWCFVSLVSFVFLRQGLKSPRLASNLTMSKDILELLALLLLLPKRWDKTQAMLYLSIFSFKQR